MPGGSFWRGLMALFGDSLFPPRCVGCGRQGQWLCGVCLAGVSWLRDGICPRCGRVWVGVTLCPFCRAHPPIADGIRALAKMDGVWRKAVHRFKYGGLRALAEPLGRLMCDYAREARLLADGVVPVPLHPQRRKERGYCQSDLLAKEVADGLGIALWEDALIRIRHTLPQVGLGEEERRANVRGAFACGSQTVTGQRVLLIDDVCTTGATLEACSQALRAGGASWVWGLVLAHSDPDWRGEGGKPIMKSPT